MRTFYKTTTHRNRRQSNWALQNRRGCFSNVTCHSSRRPTQDRLSPPGQKENLLLWPNIQIQKTQLFIQLSKLCVFLLLCEKSTLLNPFEITEMWDSVKLLRHDYFSVGFTNFFDEPISNKVCCRLLYF